MTASAFCISHMNWFDNEQVLVKAAAEATLLSRLLEAMKSCEDNDTPDAARFMAQAMSAVATLPKKLFVNNAMKLSTSELSLLVASAGTAMGNFSDDDDIENESNLDMIATRFHESKVNEKSRAMLCALIDIIVCTMWNFCREKTSEMIMLEAEKIRNATEEISSAFTGDEGSGIETVHGAFLGNFRSAFTASADRQSAERTADCANVQAAACRCLAHIPWSALTLQDQNIEAVCDALINSLRCFPNDPTVQEEGLIAVQSLACHTGDALYSDSVHNVFQRRHSSFCSQLLRSGAATHAVSILTNSIFSLKNKSLGKDGAAVQWASFEVIAALPLSNVPAQLGLSEERRLEVAEVAVALILREEKSEAPMWRAQWAAIRALETLNMLTKSKLPFEVIWSLILVGLRRYGTATSLDMLRTILCLARVARKRKNPFESSNLQDDDVQSSVRLNVVRACKITLEQLRLSCGGGKKLTLKSFKEKSIAGNVFVCGLCLEILAALPTELTVDYISIGIIPAIMNAMRYHSDSFDVQAKAVLALHALVSTRQSNQALVALANSGACDLLFSLRQQHRTFYNRSRSSLLESDEASVPELVDKLIALLLVAAKNRGASDIFGDFSAFASDMVHYDETYTASQKQDTRMEDIMGIFQNEEEIVADPFGPTLSVAEKLKDRGIGSFEKAAEAARVARAAATDAVGASLDASRAATRLWAKDRRERRQREALEARFKTLRNDAKSAAIAAVEAAARAVKQAKEMILKKESEINERILAEKRALLKKKLSVAKVNENKLKEDVEMVGEADAWDVDGHDVETDEPTEEKDPLKRNLLDNKEREPKPNEKAITAQESKETGEDKGIENVDENVSTTETKSKDEAEDKEDDNVIKLKSIPSAVTLSDSMSEDEAEFQDSDEEEGSIEPHAGYIWRQNTDNPGWRKRWFELCEDGSLLFKRNKSRPDTELEVAVENCKLYSFLETDREKMKFRLFPSSSEAGALTQGGLNLRVEDRHDMTRWRRAFHIATGMYDALGNRSPDLEEKIETVDISSLEMDHVMNLQRLLRKAVIRYRNTLRKPRVSGWMEVPAKSLAGDGDSSSGKGFLGSFFGAAEAIGISSRTIEWKKRWFSVDPSTGTFVWYKKPGEGLMTKPIHLSNYYVREHPNSKSILTQQHIDANHKLLEVAHIAEYSRDDAAADGTRPSFAFLCASRIDAERWIKGFNYAITKATSRHTSTHIHKEGWLEKKGSGAGLNPWKPRYFRLNIAEGTVSCVRLLDPTDKDGNPVAPVEPMPKVSRKAYRLRKEEIMEIRQNQRKFPLSARGALFPVEVYCDYVSGKESKSSKTEKRTLLLRAPTLALATSWCSSFRQTIQALATGAGRFEGYRHIKWYNASEERNVIDPDKSKQQYVALRVEEGAIGVWNDHDSRDDGDRPRRVIQLQNYEAKTSMHEFKVKGDRSGRLDIDDNRMMNVSWLGVNLQVKVPEGKSVGDSIVSLVPNEDGAFYIKLVYKVPPFMGAAAISALTEEEIQTALETGRKSTILLRFRTIAEATTYLKGVKKGIQNANLQWCEGVMEKRGKSSGFKGFFSRSKEPPWKMRFFTLRLTPLRCQSRDLSIHLSGGKNNSKSLHQLGWWKSASDQENGDSPRNSIHLLYNFEVRKMPSDSKDEAAMRKCFAVLPCREESGRRKVHLAVRGYNAYEMWEKSLRKASQNAAQGVQSGPVFVLRGFDEVSPETKSANVSFGFRNGKWQKRFAVLHGHGFAALVLYEKESDAYAAAEDGHNTAKEDDDGAYVRAALSASTKSALVRYLNGRFIVMDPLNEAVDGGASGMLWRLVLRHEDNRPPIVLGFEDKELRVDWQTKLQKCIDDSETKEGWLDILYGDTSRSLKWQRVWGVLEVGTRQLEMFRNPTDAGQAYENSNSPKSRAARQKKVTSVDLSGYFVPPKSRRRSVNDETMKKLIEKDQYPYSTKSATGEAVFPFQLRHQFKPDINLRALSEERRGEWIKAINNTGK
eukprot:g2741.t1